MKRINIVLRIDVPEELDENEEKTLLDKIMEQEHGSFEDHDHSVESHRLPYENRTISLVQSEMTKACKVLIYWKTWEYLGNLSE